MKKVLLAGTALLGFAAISSPAAAEINLDLGGYFRGYGVYVDHDDNFLAAGAGADLRSFDFRRDTEIHFSGETTTDNGLTVGVHSELALGGAVLTDETYMYVSGGMGRVNFGSEDGAAYLLQVAAPSADSNIDGMRNYIQGYNTGFDFDASGAIDADERLTLDYDHTGGGAFEDFQDTDRLTYLTPKWNGFQAGASYAPEAGQNVVGDNLAGMASDIDNNDFEDLWELAARWDGEFEGFGISLGGGYTTASVEEDVATAVADYADDIDTWNAGLNVAFSGFSVGASYTNSDTEVASALGPQVDTELDVDTWVVGLGYDNGPYHLGASYYDTSLDIEGVAADVDLDRAALGAGYTYGPGMTFRGSVSWVNADTVVAGGTDEDATQVTLGTDVQF